MTNLAHKISNDATRVTPVVGDVIEIIECRRLPSTRFVKRPM